MKKITLLLLTIMVMSSYADVRVTITPLNGNPIVTTPTDFKDQESADPWIADMIADKSWGEVGDYTVVILPIPYNESIAGKKAKKDEDDISIGSIRGKLLDGSAKLEDIIQYLKIKEGL